MENRTPVNPHEDRGDHGTGIILSSAASLQRKSNGMNAEE